MYRRKNKKKNELIKVNKINELHTSTTLSSKTEIKKTEILKETKKDNILSNKSIHSFNSNKNVSKSNKSIHSFNSNKNVSNTKKLTETFNKLDKINENNIIDLKDNLDNNTNNKNNNVKKNTNNYFNLKDNNIKDLDKNIYYKLYIYVLINKNYIINTLFEKNIIKNKSIPFSILFNIYINYINNDIILI